MILYEQYPLNLSVPFEMPWTCVLSVLRNAVFKIQLLLTFE